MSQITMTPADAMITLENVNKWYGQFHVLKDINQGKARRTNRSLRPFRFREIDNHSLYQPS